MSERAVNLPMGGQEIIDIILNRLKSRMMGTSALSDSLAYAGFEYAAHITIKLRGMSEPEALVWDKHAEGEKVDEAEAQIVEESETYKSDAPNVERQANDLPLTVETQDNRGKKSFKKVKVKA